MKMLYLEIASIMNICQAYGLEFKMKNLEKAINDCDYLMKLPMNKVHQNAIRALREIVRLMIKTRAESSDNKSQNDDIEASTSRSEKNPSSSQYSFAPSDTKNNPNFKDDMKIPNSDKKAYPDPSGSTKSSFSKQAQLENESGYKHFEGKRYQLAINKFTAAIALNPTSPVFFGNRAACFRKMGNIQLALSDALKAIDLDNKYWEAYSCAINSFLIFGDIKNADLFLQKFESNVSVASMRFIEFLKLENLKQYHENINSHYNERDFKECLKNTEAALKIASQCTFYQNLKIECLIMLEKYKEAEENIDMLMIGNHRDPNLMYLQGLMLFYQGLIQASIKKFEDALRADPDFKKAQIYRSHAKTYDHLTNKCRPTPLL